LSPIHAFIGVPRNLQAEQLDYWTANGAGLVSNYSVGHRSRVVAVHPSLVDTVPQADLVRRLREARAGVTTAMSLCAEAARLRRQIDEVVFGPALVDVGRIP